MHIPDGFQDARTATATGVLARRPSRRPCGTPGGACPLARAVKGPFGRVFASMPAAWAGTAVAGAAGTIFVFALAWGLARGLVPRTTSRRRPD